MSFNRVRVFQLTPSPLPDCYKWGQLQQMLFTSGDSHYRDFENVLFLCVGGDSGVVEYIKRCPGNCIDSGTKADDYCQSDATIVEQQPEYDL